MTRYAIYFTPAPQTRLWRFGSSVIGYDAAAAREVAYPDHSLFREGAGDMLSAEPKRYGFHATLKAPFELSADQSENALLRHAQATFARHPRVRLGRLEVAELGSFLALRPMAGSEDVNTLAEVCVKAFEPFRAPLSATDRARRLKSPLTGRQVANLDRWGYPYVFEEFRFHMTLTGPLPEPQRRVALKALRELFAEIDEPVVIDAASVVRQSERSARFVIVERFDLSATAERE